MGSVSDTMKQMMGPLQTAAGIGLTATGNPAMGVPLLAGGINQTTQPQQQPQPGQGPQQGPLQQFLGNGPLMSGAGQLMQGQQHPQQPPAMPPRPAQQQPATPPQVQSPQAPPVQGAMGGGQMNMSSGLTPQQLALIQQLTMRG